MFPKLGRNPFCNQVNRYRVLRNRFCGKSFQMVFREPRGPHDEFCGRHPLPSFWVNVSYWFSSKMAPARTEIRMF